MSIRAEIKMIEGTTVKRTFRDLEEYVDWLEVNREFILEAKGVRVSAEEIRQGRDG